MTVNNLWLKHKSYAPVGYDTLNFHGMSYPKQIGDLLDGDNLLWAGKVLDGQVPLIRTGGGTWRSGFVAGGITSKGVAESPASPSVRIYRIRPDFGSADLRLDASASYGVPIESVTPEMVASVHDQYDTDWKEWPWQKGAPFIDKNGNGVMDPGEIPGLLNADQVIWFAYNDLDESVCRGFAGDPPIGLEVQVTFWAYKDIPVLRDMIFKRYRLMYKGTRTTGESATIDSMYVSQWAFPTIGLDLGGCDSLLSMSFVFSDNVVFHRPPELGPAVPGGNFGEYKKFGLPIPGIGYALLQGPLIAGSQKDIGVFNFSTQRGKKNLPMTSFMLNATGDPIGEPPGGRRSRWYWNVMRGYLPLEEAGDRRWIAPDGVPTPFMLAGDPVRQTGWYDGLGKTWSDGQGGIGESMGASLRRFMMNSGPFTLALGDTQEVVYAIMASSAPDGLYNVSYLKYMTSIVRGIYPSLDEYVSEQRSRSSVSPQPNVPFEFALLQNYPNPFNPSTHISYSIPRESKTRLVILDLLGRELRVLQDGVQKAGNYVLTWDGRDERVAMVPSGVYFYRLVADRFLLTKKMILLR
ncbi:MAG: hypothetical protein A2X66_03695 [Ignavibacteria bacterium GWA2_54_16]|nr:MAG: hypothetical protein A2X66_03695 [Ignavibacteria bacterium GWA2_54_16]